MLERMIENCLFLLFEKVLERINIEINFKGKIKE